ncbi:ABC transporter ATP-binding protein [Chengkuizengella sediminis]|uniref:ABC transporter ATP-binding protein n=1 Tax=Chengkuizengella sediminis TaxID=1885917 RepID=UPI00138A0F1F|nr:ABC transporter ATP-binding protein [Chengkuizengella sediminis]NDI35293.1 ABC transporter ATP-binding protein [Chengkuizengella sediminis]
MENVITISNVNKQFKGFHLKDLSFSVKKGFITGFIGPNGSGKTTTIKLIMNLLKEDSGNIQLFGLNHENHTKEIKERIGFVYADHHFYEILTTNQMKEIIAPFYKNWSEKDFKRYMNDFNLPLNKKIKKLSSGMKMKFAIAIALSHQADLIIMDEPTSGLDPIARREILDLFKDIIQDEEKTIFFSTHITSDLEHIADYITFIHDGEILLNNEKDMLLEKYKIIRGAKKYLDEHTRQLFLGIRETDAGFEGLVNDEKTIRELLGPQVIYDRVSLEDIMYYTTRRGQYV